MRFITGNLSDRGGRDVNEDACRVFSSPSGGHCWIVADGLGGQGGGDTAARVAVDNALSAFERKPGYSVENLRYCIDAAQAAILAKQHETPSLASMRSTIVLLLANEQQASVGHVGDSRLYHLRSGAIVYQTSDHSVPQALVAAGELSPQSIRHHEDRNRLLRALGEPGEARPTVDESSRNLKPGDAFLLCTDGFWEHVYETEIEADFAKAINPESWLALMHSRLRSRIGVATDNYTALAVFVEGV